VCSAISSVKERFLCQILRFMSASLSLRLGLQAHLVFRANMALLRARILFSSLVLRGAERALGRNCNAMNTLQ